MATRDRPVLPLVLLMALLPLAPLLATSSVVMAALQGERPIGDRLGRSQFGAVASGSLLVWEDRVVALARGQDEGTSDLYGLDLATNRPFTVSDAPGDQTMPAIDGALVIWQDSRHSCPGCEADIRGKDLGSGAELVVADGSAHQVLPAVAGRTVAWMEQAELPDGTAQRRLLTFDLDTRQEAEIARAPSGVTLDRPALSRSHLVWAEVTARGKTISYRLRAYDRATGRIADVATSEYINTQYALSGSRLAVAGAGVTLIDLASGVRRPLAGARTTSPRIDGDTVVWSGVDARLAPQPQVFGIDLRAGPAKPLVSGAEGAHAPALAGDQLVWQRYDGQCTRLLAASRAQAFAGALLLAVAQAPAPGSESAPSDTLLTAQVVPLSIKGIHTPNHIQRAGDNSWTGWYNANGSACLNGSCHAIDNLIVNGGDPLFGAYVVLHNSYKVGESDLDRDTGRYWPAVPGSSGGTLVTHAMAYAKSRGARVIVRLSQTYIAGNPSDANNDIPTNTTGTECPRDYPPNPSHVRNHVNALVHPTTGRHRWIKEIQIHNEPNLEWPYLNQQRLKWRLDVNGVQRCYNYAAYGLRDPNFYQAIGQYYDDVKLELERGVAWGQIPGDVIFWPPPLTDLYGPLDNGVNMYDMGNMPNMILNRFARFTVHTYPAPNWDLDANDHIFNNSWPHWPWWLQQYVDNGSLPNIVTEFGWNEGQMRRFLPGTAPKDCASQGWEVYQVAQWSFWPAGSNNGECGTEDPQPTNPNVNATTHYFFDDTVHFILYQRHNAQLVAVWLLRGGSDWPIDQVPSPTTEGLFRGVDRVDGIDDYGNLRPWFASYKAWNP